MATAISGIPLGPLLSEEQARAIYALGEDAVVFALLAQSKLLSEQQAEAAFTSHQTPSTPFGHAASLRETPDACARQEKAGTQDGPPRQPARAAPNVSTGVKHTAPRCVPTAAGRWTAARRPARATPKTYPEGIRPEITEHTIHRDWCPRCKKKVEPVVAAALPGATLGNRVLVLSAWLHYVLGNTLSQIVEVFDFHLLFQVTPGGLLHMWRRLAEILLPWYEAHSPGSAGLGGAQRRRDRLAREWQDPMAVVFRHQRAELFPDRPFAGESGAPAVLHAGIRRNAGGRLLGRVQRRGVRRPAEVPRAFVARTRARGEIQIAQPGLARLRQKAAPPDCRRHPAVAAARRARTGGVRLAPRALRPALAGLVRYALGGRQRQAPHKKAAPTPG